MKNVRRFAIVFLLLLGQQVIGQEKTTFRVINNTNRTVYVAYAYFDSQNKEYVSVGWYEVAAYGERDWDLGYLTGKFFVHGYSDKVIRWNLIGEPIKQKTTWGKGYNFCVDSKGFKIRDADIINCDRKENFGVTQLTSGLNKWRIDP